MKKSYLALLLLLSITIFFSCEQEELNEVHSFNTESNDLASKSISKKTIPSGLTIFPGVFSDLQCYSSDNTIGQKYLIYITTGQGNTKGYDRYIDVVISQNHNIIEGKTLLVEANNTVSSSVRIFSGAYTSKIGDVVVTPTNVRKSDGSLDNEIYELQTANYNINNCYEKLIIGDDPKFCIEDADGDGICADIDPNDNDPCIPSCIEN